MPYKVIYMEQINVKRQQNGRDLLAIRLRDEGGTEYSWVPKWNDLREAFRQAYLVEIRNARREPEKFEVLVRSLLATQRVQDAELVTGRLRRLGEGYLELVTEEAYTVDDEYRDATIEVPEEAERYPVAFEFDEDWLLHHLQRQVRCLVIGGAICKVEPIPEADSE